MGLHYTAINNMSFSKLPRRVNRVPPGSPGAARRRAIYRVADVMAYLHHKRSPLWAIDRGDGTHQALSETPSSRIATPSRMTAGRIPLLVDMLTELQVNTRLGDVRSAFERFNIREK